MKKNKILLKNAYKFIFGLIIFILPSISVNADMQITTDFNQNRILKCVYEGNINTTDIQEYSGAAIKAELYLMADNTVNISLMSPDCNNEFMGTNSGECDSEYNEYIAKINFKDFSSCPGIIYYHHQTSYMYGDDLDYKVSEYSDARNTWSDNPNIMYYEKGCTGNEEECKGISKDECCRLDYIETLELKRNESYTSTERKCIYKYDTSGKNLVKTDTGNIIVTLKTGGPSFDKSWPSCGFDTSTPTRIFENVTDCPPKIYCNTDDSCLAKNKYGWQTTECKGTGTTSSGNSSETILRTKTIYKNGSSSFTVSTFLTFSTSDKEMSSGKSNIGGIGSFYLTRKIYTPNHNEQWYYYLCNGSGCTGKLDNSTSDLVVNRNVLVYNYDSKIAKNEDLPDKLYVNEEEGKIYTQKFPNVGTLVEYKRQDKETETKEISGSNLIRCDVEDSYVTFSISADGKPDFYVRETGKVGGLELSIALTASNIEMLLDPNTSTPPLQVTKINEEKQFWVNVVGGIGAIFVGYVLLAPVAGAGALGTLISQGAGGAVKITIASAGIEAGLHKFIGSNVRVVDCGGSEESGTCLEFLTILKSGTSEPGNCRVIKDDESSKWEETDVKELECKTLKDTKFWKIIKYILNLLRTVACIVLIVFGAIDFAKSIMSGDADALKKSGTTFVKRLILTVFIFFIPAIIDLLFTIIGKTQC